MNAWNALVAPRYNGIRNFEWKTIQSFESISYLRADATEKASGRNVHVVLFKKHSSKGDGRYLEFVAGSRGELEAAFGAYRNEEFGWERYADMQFRNKFPAGAADLLGNWGASDYASLRYYYVSNGGFAGATATSLADLFTFLPGGRYESDHTGASGTVGNQKWSRQIYKGNVSVNGWSMTLTNRFQGEGENFQCHCSATERGGAGWEDFGADGSAGDADDAGKGALIVWWRRLAVLGGFVGLGLIREVGYRDCV